MKDEPIPPKKVSVLLSQDYIRKIQDAKLSQTEALTRGLDILFSEDYQRIQEYKNKISEDEKKILVLEARLAESDSLKDLMVEQITLSKAHISQVQMMLNSREDERRSREDQIRQKDEKILQLEDGKKKPWWKIW